MFIKKFADDWIRTMDLWNRKWLPYQLSHNYCQILSSSLLLCQIVYYLPTPLNPQIFEKDIFLGQKIQFRPVQWFVK